MRKLRIECTINDPCFVNRLMGKEMGKEGFEIGFRKSNQSVLFERKNWLEKATKD